MRNPPPQGGGFFAIVGNGLRAVPPMPDGIGKPAALRRRAIHESPLRVGAAWIERKPVGNAVPGVPGDRKGRPYAIRTHRRGGALTRPPPQRGGKNPLPRGKRFCAPRWAVQKDGRTIGETGPAPVHLCHCEERSDVAISCTMYPIRLHRFTSYIQDFRCEPTSHRIRLRRWRLPRLRLAMTW